LGETKLSKNKKSPVVHIYVKPERIHLYHRIRDILRREGKSLSDFIWEQIESYVRLHEPGNPQQRIDRFINHDKPYIAPVKCGFGSKKNPCDKPAVAIAISESGKEMPVCKYHFVLIAQSKTSKWRIKDYSPGGLGHAPDPQKAKRRDERRHTP